MIWGQEITGLSTYSATGRLSFCRRVFIYFRWLLLPHYALLSLARQPRTCDIITYVLCFVVAMRFSCLPHTMPRPPCHTTEARFSKPFYYYVGIDLKWHECTLVVNMLPKCHAMAILSVWTRREFTTSTQQRHPTLYKRMIVGTGHWFN